MVRVTRNPPIGWRSFAAVDSKVLLPVFWFYVHDKRASIHSLDDPMLTHLVRLALDIIAYDGRHDVRHLLVDCFSH